MSFERSRCRKPQLAGRVLQRPVRAVTLAVVCATFAVLLPERAAGQAGGEPGVLTRQMTSAKSGERSAAFYSLLRLGSEGDEAKGLVKVRAWLSALMRRYPQSAEQIKLTLMKTLELENSIVRKGQSLSSGYTDYYGDLVQAVTALDDPRSAGALAGALGTGNMVIRALANLGEASVDPVIGELKHAQDKTVTESACLVLERLLDPVNRNSVKTPEQREKILKVLTGPPCGRRAQDHHCGH